jgi:hypothetical protein
MARSILGLGDKPVRKLLGVLPPILIDYGKDLHEYDPYRRAWGKGRHTDIFA